MFATALTFPAVADSPLPINLSGYEFLLGVNCTIGGQPAKCGVAFTGWTGGSGQDATGWTPFPGTDRGLWEAMINYRGDVDFGSSVQILGGSFDLLFKSGKVVLGKVTGGSVVWPASAADSLACGPGVADLTVNLTIGGVPHTVDGCLHDLPAGSVIPPKIWGTLQ